MLHTRQRARGAHILQVKLRKRAEEVGWRKLPLIGSYAGGKRRGIPTDTPVTVAVGRCGGKHTVLWD